MKRIFAGGILRTRHKGYFEKTFPAVPTISVPDLQMNCRWIADVFGLKRKVPFKTLEKHSKSLNQIRPKSVQTLLNSMFYNHRRAIRRDKKSFRLLSLILFPYLQLIF